MKKKSLMGIEKNSVKFCQTFFLSQAYNNYQFTKYVIQYLKTLKKKRCCGVEYQGVPLIHTLWTVITTQSQTLQQVQRLQIPTISYNQPFEYTTSGIPNLACKLVASVLGDGHYSYCLYTKSDKVFGYAADRDELSKNVIYAKMEIFLNCINHSPTQSCLQR